MPGGDRTGPMGAGPMTGRAMGYCAGSPAPGYATPGLGRGWFGRGRGGGRGRGWRNWFRATGLTGWQRAAMGWGAWGGAVPPAAPSKETELQVLRQQAKELAQALDQINQRIEQLEKQAAEASS